MYLAPVLRRKPPSSRAPVCRRRTAPGLADQYDDAVEAVPDMAGGLLLTLPSARDWESPATRPCLERCVAGSPRMPTEQRLKAMRMARDVVASDSGTVWEVTTVHAKASLAAERLATYREAELDRFRKVAARTAGVGG